MLRQMRGIGMTDQIPMPPDQFDEIVAIIKANTDGSLMHEVDMFFRPVEYPRAAGETAWFLQHMFNHSHPTLFHAPAKGGLVQYIRGYDSSGT